MVRTKVAEQQESQLAGASIADQNNAMTKQAIVPACTQNTNRQGYRNTMMVNIKVPATFLLLSACAEAFQAPMPCSTATKSVLQRLNAVHVPQNSDLPLPDNSAERLPQETELESESVPLAPSQPKSGQAGLPKWARDANKSLNIKLFTHADKRHVHAISGSLWYLGGYGVLISAWAKELLFNDWSTFRSLDGVILPAALLGAVVCSVASSPLRHDKRFPRYSDMMRNGMVTGCLTSVLTASFAMDLSVLSNPILHGASQATVLASSVVLAYMSIVDRMPWDIPDLIDELELEMPPEWILKTGRVIAFAWMFMLATAASHAIFPGGAMMMDDPMTRAFAAQMALSLSMAPSGDALAGTLMQKDRFTNKSGSHWMIRKTEEGKYRTSPIAEFFQLLLNDPGPFVITIAVALLTDHADVVRSFFYMA